MKFITILVLLLCIGCKEQEMYINDPYSCNQVYQGAQTTKPNILIIGDSISIDYITYTRLQIDSHDVIHNRCNAGYSFHGVESIDSWIGQANSWDLITFNHGIWDARALFEGRITIEDYKANLRYIGMKLKTASPKVIFFLTTKITAYVPDRTNDEVITLNDAAQEVMNELGIPVYDLYSYSESIIEYYASDGIHFTTTGSSLLGDFVSNAINEQLK